MFLVVALILCMDVTKGTDCPIPIPLNVTSVDCTSKGLVSIPDLHRGLVNVTLTSNEITSISKGIFNSLQSLKSLTLRNNNISSVSFAAFENLPSLRSLSLYGNKIPRIQTDVFIGLLELIYLDLGNNEITSISYTAFLNLPSLQTLGLANNQITSLPTGIFDDLSSLRRLSLLGNKISTIPPGVFNGLSALTELNLKNNPLLCTFDLQKALKEVSSNTLLGTCKNVTSNTLSELKVFRDSPFQFDKLFCESQLYLGVSWQETFVSKTDRGPCPGSATGFTTRQCVSDKGTIRWSSEVSYLGCSTDIFAKLNNQTEDVLAGRANNQTVAEVLTKLASATDVREETGQKPIYGRDLEISVNILKMILQYNSTEVVDKENRQNYINVASNLLDPVNTETWHGLRKERKNTERELIKVIDDYGHKVGSLVPGKQNTFTIRSKTIGFQVKRFNYQNKSSVQRVSFRFNHTSISLPAEVVQPVSPVMVTVVNVVYLTLNNILKLATGDVALVSGKNKRRFSDVYADTTMVSSTVRPPLRGELKTPLHIVLQNINVTKPNTVGTCVFWKPGLLPFWNAYGCGRVSDESNETITTCSCNHLTVFAAFLDPYGTTIAQKHEKPLEIISAVGCSVSLLAVLTTISVMLFFWKKLKNPRTVVLVNLCVAIAITCVLVISESSAHDNLASCTVLAALLHFFLLSVFSWMLCEGFLHYYAVTEMTKMSNERIKYFVGLGWCFPAVIVAISLGVTKLEGYGDINKTCWLATDNGLIWAFVGPATFVIAVNLVVLVLVLCKLTNTRRFKRKEHAQKVKTGIKATLMIFPLLGITWVLGLLAFESAAVTVKYCFAIFNSLQGFMIFIFHCVMNEKVQQEFKSYRTKSQADKSLRVTRATGNGDTESSRKPECETMTPVVLVSGSRSKTL